MRTSFIFILMFLTSACWAAEKFPATPLCTGIDQKLPDRSFSAKIISVIGEQVPKKENLDQSVVITRIDQYLGKDNWHIVWATPENMERGVFLLRGDTKKLEYVAVWGGIALPEEEPEVLKWFVGQAPTAPISLLRCAAHSVTHGKE